MVGEKMDLELALVIAFDAPNMEGSDSPAEVNFYMKRPGQPPNILWPILLRGQKMVAKIYILKRIIMISD
jgi:hypothetical protein